MGRIALFEIMKMNNEIKSLVAKKAEPHEIKKAAIENGMRTLFQSGISQALRGMTTVDEVIKVAGTAVD
jgi:type II secretory ATPase GspE/PulE/Tfp pilus assembly ATPase PilB-like protein